MFKSLKDIIKKIEGNVVAICLDEELITELNKNSKIGLYSIDSSKSSSKFTNSKKKRTNKGKRVNIKKLRKYLNKKSVDHLFINMNEVYKYYKYIIRDSILINKNKIYIYFDSNIDKDFIIKKYKRYNVSIKKTEYKNGFILEVDNKNGKNNFFKDFIYLIEDTFYNIAEFIGNVLIS